MVADWVTAVGDADPSTPLFVDTYPDTVDDAPDAPRRRNEWLVGEQRDLCLVFVAREDEEPLFAELARERGLTVWQHVQGQRCPVQVAAPSGTNTVVARLRHAVRAGGSQCWCRAARSAARSAPPGGCRPGADSAGGADETLLVVAPGASITSRLLDPSAPGPRDAPRPAPS